MQYHWRMSMTFLNAFHLRHAGDVSSATPRQSSTRHTLELKDQPTKDTVKKQLAAFAKFIKRMKAGA